MKKKVLLSTLVATLGLVSLVGCDNKQEEPFVEPIGGGDIGQLAGGWSASSATTIEAFEDEEIASVYESAVGRINTLLTPMAYLGSQVVAGTNYAFLTKNALTPNSSKLTLVTAYKDLSGEVDNVKATDFEISLFKEKESEGSNEPLLGGWYFGEASGTELEGMAKEAFEKAMSGLLGVHYEPVALLGSQVVAGTNYAYLCKSTVVVPNATPTLKVVYVYYDLQQNAEISEIADFEIKDIIK